MYARMLERLSVGVPVMTSPGNHEMEYQADGYAFAAYTSRCGRAGARRALAWLRLQLCPGKARAARLVTLA